MLLRELTYELDPRNIACEPREVRLGRRDLSRMLVVDRQRGALSDSSVLEICKFLAPGDVLVLNNSKRLPGVIKARVAGRAKVDIRVVGLQTDLTCLASVSPMHAVRAGSALHFDDGNIAVVERLDVGPHRLCLLRTQRGLVQSLKAVGRPITSFFYSSYFDIESYNPVYAKQEGSVESPMAGLHFTPDLLSEIEGHGIQVAEITLHVVGSWLPPLGRSTCDYAVYGEAFEVSEEAAAAINRAKGAGRRVIAVGSTVVRALETAALSWQAAPEPLKAVSELFITPGHQFRVVDAYFTNFHPAQSGLMALDAAFCPRDLLMLAYAHANRSRYAFLEFGDAVFYT